ncbi:hypothetical protein GH740_08270 [Microbacterium sp. SYP-A9085]|uniref:hypothetical protein n=1 Tax=Microbacterium sp. SYP-A9085 TaxID=2664454 RepID=UPI00129BB3CD|nr:hypothetical protein [Microbacterium sp. SYP-A9085]MRH29312.1 hypothetical protein [Microbacterium sp. SYP-A9085]
MPRVLLTGFAPDAGDAANPSGDAVRLVPALWGRREPLVVDVLPVTFSGAAQRLRALIALIARALMIAARTALDVREDAAAPGGTLH